jgi:2-keto-3-deoxy-L-rhamnonate aldolase RhmA
MNFLDHYESYGIWRIIPSLTLTDIIAQSKYDFQILDCEHGAYDFHTLEQDIKICHLNNSLAYVRVSGLNKVEVQRCLDLGADGIVFPQLNSYEDFNLATKMTQYAPKGIRGFNPFVSTGKYGYENISEKKIKCIAIIETLNAVTELERILSIVELDILYIGVYDLSAQLDCIGKMDSPELLMLIDNIIACCKKASKNVGLMINNIEDLKRYKKKGVNIFVHSVDSFIIKNVFTNAMNNFKLTDNG